MNVIGSYIQYYAYFLISLHLRIPLHWYILSSTSLHTVCQSLTVQPFWLVWVPRVVSLLVCSGGPISWWYAHLGYARHTPMFLSYYTFTSICTPSIPQSLDKQHYHALLTPIFFSLLLSIGSWSWLIPFLCQIARQIMGKFFPMQWVENLAPTYGLVLRVDNSGRYTPNNLMEWSWWNVTRPILNVETFLVLTGLEMNERPFQSCHVTLFLMELTSTDWLITNSWLYQPDFIWQSVGVMAWQKWETHCVDFRST